MSALIGFGVSRLIFPSKLGTLSEKIWPPYPKHMKTVWWIVTTGKVESGTKKYSSEEHGLLSENRCLVALFTGYEDGGSTFPRNMGKFLPDYMRSHPRRYHGRGTSNLTNAV
jgi:hypothetical protein